MPAASAVAAARHPHLADTVRDGWWRVDLHCHTMWSGDSTTTPEELSVALDECGLDVVCITDHQSIAGAQRLRDTMAAEVVVGEEIRSSAGEIIGLFLTERVPPQMSALETAAAIRDQGGVVYIPHPFDLMRAHLRADALDDLVTAGLVDAIEVLNAKTSLAHLNARARDYALEHGLVAGAGSDAHIPEAFGAAYVEMPTFGDASSFLDALGGATVVGHHWDQARPWRAKVVPSVVSLES